MLCAFQWSAVRNGSASAKSAFGPSDHGDSFNGGSLSRPIIGIGGQLPDFTDDFHTGSVCGASECGVLSVEVSMSTEADEELRAAGIRVIGTGHGEHTGDVWCGIEFGSDRVSRATGTGALWATALNHESADDAVKYDTVVVTDSSQSDHVGAVSWCNFGEQVEQDGSVIGFQFDLVAVGIEIDVFDGCGDFNLAILAHGMLSLGLTDFAIRREFLIFGRERKPGAIFSTIRMPCEGV